MILSTNDKTSNLWLRLMEEHLALLQSLRSRNDGRMDENTRNVLIGRIQQVKQFLSMGAEPVNIE